MRAYLRDLWLGCKLLGCFLVERIADLPPQMDEWTSQFREAHDMDPDWEVERRRAARHVSR